MTALGELPRVLVLTDRSQLPLGRSLLANLGAAADAGLSHVVLRELDLTDDRRAGLAERLTALGLTVLAARRPLAGCAGVHLASDQPPVAATPYGRSCHSAADLRRAAAAGASYATLSPFAVTASKPGYGPPLPPEEYDDPPLPTYALAGVTPANAAAAREAGAHGVAVMGTVMRAEDPGAVVAALLRAAG